MSPRRLWIDSHVATIILAVMAFAQSAFAEPCGTVQSQSVPSLVDLGVKTVLPVSADHAFEWTGEAGSNIYFQLFRANPAGGPLMRIVLSAKTSDENSFRQMCDTGWVTVPAGIEPTLYRGQGGSGRVTWNIAVYDQRDLSGIQNFVVSLKLRIFRDRDDVLFPPGTASPQSTNAPASRGMSRTSTQQPLSNRASPVSGQITPDPPGIAAAPLDLLCWQITGQRNGQRTPRLPSVFSNASALVIELNDKAQPASTAVKHLLTQNIAKALALWRLACLGCGPYNVAVIRLDSEVYMDSDLAGYFERCTFTGKVRPGAPYSPPPTEGPMRCEDADVLLSSRVGGRGVSKSYRQVTSTQGALARLCQQSSSQLIPEFRQMQSAGCGLPGGSGDYAHLQIEFTGRKTDCGNDRGTVACAAPDRKMQLNVNDWRFISRDGQESFGSGTDKVDLLRILLHESGHWMGLRHADNDPGNIMSSLFPDVRCITNATVDALTQVVDLTDKERLGGFGELRFPINAR